MVIGNGSFHKPIIQTQRLDLRDFRESDWVEVHEYGSDPLVVRFMNWGPNTEEQTRFFIQKSIGYQKEAPRMHYSLAVVVREQNRLIGGCGVYLSSVESREGFFGYCLNRRFWGQGYATETARALLEFGFGKLNLHRVFATCDSENTASAHVLEKNRLRCEGRFREKVYCRGMWRDELVYAILEGEWKASNVDGQKPKLQLTSSNFPN